MYVRGFFYTRKRALEQTYRDLRGSELRDLRVLMSNLMQRMNYNSPDSIELILQNYRDIQSLSLTGRTEFMDLFLEINLALKAVGLGEEVLAELDGMGNPGRKAELVSLLQSVWFKE